MGAKKVVNQTSATLTVKLSVRKGDTPGTLAGTQTYQVPAGKTQVCTYSQNINPYLDSVALSASLDGGMVTSQQTVQTRGGRIDSAFNTNDTMTVSMSGGNLVSTYTNS